MKYQIRLRNYPEMGQLYPDAVDQRDYDDINAAYIQTSSYDKFRLKIQYQYFVEEAPTLTGPFCMHCHSNQHLGINCDRLRINGRVI